jgi:Ca2+:H+ antiporter
VNWLLAFVPIAAVLEYAFPSWHTAVFAASALAIVPLARWLGNATDHLARHAGEGVGGLLNATFGNAAELMIALFGLRAGLTGVVKASLTGSIISNLLLVLGGAILAGGMRFKFQRFNAAAARVRATGLTLAAIALIAPAVFVELSGTREARRELSAEIAIVLLITYLLGLLFALHTHRQLFTGQPDTPEQDLTEAWSVRKAIATLAVSTALVAWMSEILVGAITPAAQALGMTGLFIGVIVVGIVGNAAEHASAIMAARRNKIDLAVGIAIGSSTQMALFISPVVVLASYAIGPRPMDLVFTAPEILAIAAAVWIAALVAGDGESNWLEGVQLLAVYVILAITFYFLPGR